MTAPAVRTPGAIVSAYRAISAERQRRAGIPFGARSYRESRDLWDLHAALYSELADQDHDLAELVAREHHHAIQAAECTSDEGRAWHTDRRAVATRAIEAVLYAA